MERMTSENPKGNYECLMNYCTTGEDRWATLKYAGGKENAKLCELLECINEDMNDLRR